MSMKVHSGLRFTTPDTNVVLDALLGTREAVVCEQQRLLARTLAQDVVVEYDKGHLDGTLVDPTARGRIYTQIKQAMRDAIFKSEREGSHGPAIDVDAEIVVAPFEGALYGVLFCAQPEIARIVRAGLPCVDYAYFGYPDFRVDPEASVLFGSDAQEQPVAPTSRTESRRPVHEG